jgi:hypothetical protein
MARKKNEERERERIKLCISASVFDEYAYVYNEKKKSIMHDAVK